MAVCDGLGSASLSGLAAERAAYLAVTEGELEALDKEPLDLVVLMAEAARAAIEVAAEDCDAGLSDLATTFIGCVLKDGVIATAHIGDGGVVASSGQSLVLVSPPEDAEYVNEVTPLSSEKWRDHLRVNSADEVDSACLFTDGVQRAALIRKQGAWDPLTGFFTPLFSHVAEGGDAESLSSFLAGVRMSEVSDDDKTLLIANLVQCNSSIEAAAV